MAVGLLAAGIDPARSILFVQSHVAEHTELGWILTTVTPLGELERQTAFKEKAQRQESVPAGLLNYPILQAADVLLYLATLVPVGEDQVQHLELMREIARRWNAPLRCRLLSRSRNRSSPPRSVCWGSTARPRCPRVSATRSGCSNRPRRSGRSSGPPRPIRRARRARIRATPTSATSSRSTRASRRPTCRPTVALKCRTAAWGCLDCKRVLADHMIAELTPIRERAGAISWRNRQRARCAQGWRRAGAGIARTTMPEVRRRMGFPRRRGRLMQDLLTQLSDIFHLDLLLQLGLSVLLRRGDRDGAEALGQAGGAANQHSDLRRARRCSRCCRFRLVAGGRGDPARVAAQILPGVGFIGAGTILHARGSVTGLTSAATIWVVAAIGMALGVGGLHRSRSAPRCS